jgi:hypothetical protein
MPEREIDDVISDGGPQQVAVQLGVGERKMGALQSKSA